MLKRLSIFQRIAIGNSIVILIGATAGTLLTRHLTGQAAASWLILLFASAGTLLSVATNIWIIENSLRPLHRLRGLTVSGTNGDLSSIEPSLLHHPDPDITQLAQALQTLIGQLEERNQQLAALSGQVLHAQEEERKRIARSLHDDTAQALSTLIIALDRIETRLPPAAEELRPNVEAARRLAQQTVRELRAIIYGLRPSILDDLGLVPAIREYARAQLEENGIEVIIQAAQEKESIPSEVNTILFRIAQEAINNIRRHAHAQCATVSLEREASCLRLTIEDNGRGFDLNNTASQAVKMKKFGLLGMRERVELISGQLAIESAPQAGTRVIVTLPVSDREEMIIDG